MFLEIKNYSTKDWVSCEQHMQSKYTTLCMINPLFILGKVESVSSHIFSAMSNDSYTINNHKDVYLLYCKISHETLNHHLEKLKLKGLFSISQLTRQF